MYYYIKLDTTEDIQAEWFPLMIPIQTFLFVGKIEYLSVLRQRLDICVEQCGLPRRAGTGQV